MAIDRLGRGSECARAWWTPVVPLEMHKLDQPCQQIWVSWCRSYPGFGYFERHLQLIVCSPLRGGRRFVGHDPEEPSGQIPPPSFGQPLDGPASAQPQPRPRLAFSDMVARLSIDTTPNGDGLSAAAHRSLCGLPLVLRSRRVRNGSQSTARGSA